MVKRVNLLVTVAMFVLVSCEQELLYAPEDVCAVHFTARLASPTASVTRTVFSDKTIPVVVGEGGDATVMQLPALELTWEEDETVDVLHVNDENPDIVSRSATIGGTRLDNFSYAFRGNARNLAEGEHYEYFYPGGTAYYTTATMERIAIDLSQQTQMGNGTRAHLKRYLPMHWEYRGQLSHEEDVIDEQTGDVTGHVTVIDRPAGYVPRIYGAVVHVIFHAPPSVLSLEVTKAELFSSETEIAPTLQIENINVNNYNQLGNYFDFAKRAHATQQRHGPITLNIHSYEGNNIWDLYFVVGPSEQVDHLYLRLSCTRAIVIDNNRSAREVKENYSYLRQLYDGSEGSKQFQAGKYYEFESYSNN